MIDGTPRKRVPATPLHIAVERHEAHVSAFRAGVEPVAEGPSLYRLALAVVNRRGALDLYRRTRTS